MILKNHIKLIESIANEGALRSSKPVKWKATDVCTEEAIKFLTEDMKAHINMTTSWDWDADYRFAEKFYDDATIKAILLTKGNVNNVRGVDLFMAVAKRVHKKRLHTLRKMEEKGLVKTGWVGNGVGSSTFGVTKSRLYELIIIDEGWSIDINSRAKTHYYKDGKSLCGRVEIKKHMRNFSKQKGSIYFEQCPTCVKKQLAILEIETQ